MIIYIFSDFQGEKLIPDGEPDLVILLGDIYYGDALEIDKKYNCDKIGVYGNHDTKNEWKQTNIKVIHEDTFVWNGITFAGFGGSPRYNSKPNQYTEEECSKYLSNLDTVNVFIAHSNPVYDKNISEWDSHRGFASFNRYIEERKPQYFLHGHLHTPFSKRIGETKIYCVYPFLELNI